MTKRLLWILYETDTFYLWSLKAPYWLSTASLTTDFTKWTMKLQDLWRENTAIQAASSSLILRYLPQAGSRIKVWPEDGARWMLLPRSTGLILCMVAMLGLLRLSLSGYTLLNLVIRRVVRPNPKSIHPFAFCHLSGARSRWQQAE